MAASDPDSLLDSLRDGDFTALLGLPECQWMDVKDGIYPLDSPTGKEELAKDVAAFANGATGGLLVVGYSTEPRLGEEFVTALRPVPRAQVDRKRYGDVLAERVIPQPHGLTIEWFPVDDEKGVLAIHVPPQPVQRTPFVIPGPTGKSQASPMSVAVPVRRNDQTIWLRPHEIQRLLAAGLRHERDNRGGELASLITRAAAVVSSYEVGDGEAGWKGPFRTAYDELRGRVPVGGAVSEVHRAGPGVVQRLGGTGAGSGWVLCGLPRRPVVAVAEEIWDGLHVAGSGIRHADVVTALGLPVADQGRGAVIGADEIAVHLRGGQWGPGRLIRPDGDGWAWEPVPSSDFEVTRNALNWTGGPKPPQLRARVVATLPWAWPEDCVISGEKRRQLAEWLPAGDLAAAVTALSRHRGAELRLDGWRDGPNRNGPHSVSRSGGIASLDGRTALSCEVMLALPGVMSDAVVTCAELRVEDIAAWADALDDTRRTAAPLTVGELIEFFVAAWHTATDVLPTVLDPSPWGNHWTQPPKVELRLSAERSRQFGRLLLPDLIDFTPFGTAPDQDVQTMSCTITAAPRRSPEDRRAQTSRALMNMGLAAGYLDAFSSALDSTG
ncbi:hypothetical protein [Actinophytocola sp. KF-1]